jgi:cell division protein FtsA
MPVRRGSPMGIGGLTDVVNSPLYATGVGLVLFGSQNIAREKLSRTEGNFISRPFKRLKQWVLEFF